MDATYKTTMYAIPLFFICVHTNVGYTVVAEFMCQMEDQASISEALAVLSKMRFVYVVDISLWAFLICNM